MDGRTHLTEDGDSGQGPRDTRDRSARLGAWCSSNAPPGLVRTSPDVALRRCTHGSGMERGSTRVELGGLRCVSLGFRDGGPPVRLDVRPPQGF